MTIKKFISSIESLYGKYQDAWRIWVEDYLIIYDEIELEELFHYTILMHSTRWNAIPDIAIFEEIRKNYCKRYDQQLGKDWLEYLHHRRKEIEYQKKQDLSLKKLKDDNQQFATEEEINLIWEEIHSKLKLKQIVRKENDF
jgi:hypothetical protein